MVNVVIVSDIPAAAAVSSSYTSRSRASSTHSLSFTPVVSCPVHLVHAAVDSRNWFFFNFTSTTPLSLAGAVHNNYYTFVGTQWRHGGGAEQLSVGRAMCAWFRFLF